MGIKSRLSLIVGVLATMAGMAADPYVGYVYPVGMRAGTTNLLVVGGQGFWGRMGAGVTGRGVEVLEVERMALSAPPTGSQLKWMRTWLDNLITNGASAGPAYPTNAAARVDEWTVNAWWTTLDQLGRRQLEAVERDVFIRKNPLQMSPSLRQIVFVKVAVAPDAPPGRRDFCVWGANGISPPRAFYVCREKRVEEPLYTPPHRQAPPPLRVEDFPCVLDGRIMPGETDRFELVLRKGEKMHFNVIARELQPYIGDAVPGFFNAVLRLVSPDGKEAAFADDRARFLPDPELEFTAPADGVYTLEIHDNLFRGREDFVYAIEIARSAGKAEKAATKPAETAGGWWRWLWGESVQSLALGGEARGCIQPGQADVYGFELEGPGAYILDLRARRDGSTLDACLTLRDEDGKTLWRHDDVTNALFTGSIAQAECDAAGRVELAAGEKRKYTIAVEDLTGHGGEGYDYTLSLKREAPGFQVYASRSAFTARPGARLPVSFHVERFGGFQGEVMVLEGESYRFENGIIPVGTNEIKTLFVGRNREERPLKDIRLRALGEIGDTAKLVEVIPADECMQAFAWRHLLTARSFLLKELLWPQTRMYNLRPSETVVLVGSAASSNTVNDLRLYFDLRRPKRAPEVRAVAALPPPPFAKLDRYLMLTPMPYDQYAPRKAPNRKLNEPLFAEARAIFKDAAVRKIALADLHDPLTQYLRERPRLKLCGEDRLTPSPVMRLLALAKICEALNENGEVATVRLNALNGKEEVSNARIRDVRLTPTGVEFVYVARSWPLAVTSAYRQADKIFPLTQKLNRELFHVKGLKLGRYSLKFDGREVGRYSASELEKGVNVALLDTPNQRRAQQAQAAMGKPGYRPPDRPGAVKVEISPVPVGKAK